MEWSEAVLFFAVATALYGSALAAGFAQSRAKEGCQQTDRRTDRRASGKRRDEAAVSGDREAMDTAMENLAAYGTGQAQTEVEDRHEVWQG